MRYSPQKLKSSIMTPKGISKNPLKNKLNVSFSTNNIIFKTDDKTNLNSSKNSGHWHTKSSLSSSLSLMDTQKLQNSQKAKARPSIDLLYPLAQFSDNRNFYQNPQNKPINMKKLHKMTSSSTDTSEYSSFSGIFSTSNIIWKNKRGQINRINTETSIKSVSNDFQSSLRVVFSQLVENFFALLYLKKKIRYLTYQIWVNIINKSDLLNKDFHKIDSNSFCNAIKNIFGNDYKLSQIQNMVEKFFPETESIVYEQFEDQLSVESEFVDFLMERAYEKRFSNFTPPKLVNAFLKNMIEFADLERKLKMICKANEIQAIKFVMSICNGKIIKISKFAAFLEEQKANKIAFGLKLSEQKLTNFLDKILQRRITKFDFMNWLGIIES